MEESEHPPKYVASRLRSRNGAIKDLRTLTTQK
jgi:hypothetical protein